MSVLSQVNVLDMIDLKRDLQYRIDATRQISQAYNDLESLLKLSQDLRSYSEKNRAFAKGIRDEAARRRAALSTS